MHAGAALLAAAAAVMPGPAQPWATVNVCDTPRHPAEVGVRAAMPARPRGAQRLVRFRLQWLDGDRWRQVEGADSGWQRLGIARRRAVESGWSFELAAPRRPVTFRGVVRFRWTENRRIVRRDREVTEPGHRSTAGADPAGYSAATCSMG